VIPDSTYTVTHQYLWRNVQIWLINQFKAMTA